MGSIICSLLRSKMKEQQSNYRVLADPRHILQIPFGSEQWEPVGTKGEQALAQAAFQARMPTVFWKYETTLQWIQTQQRLWHDLWSKFLESNRLLSSVHQRITHVDTNCCTPVQAPHVLAEAGSSDPPQQSGPATWFGGNCEYPSLR